jgi:hypothetical protein
MVRFDGVEMPVSAPEPETPLLVYLRGQPAAGLAELVIGHGGHKCTVYRLTYSQIQQISAQAADLSWKWKPR